MSGFVLSEKPLEIASGSGVHLKGANGTDYLDFGASYACTPVGHCHPEVVDAATEQVEELLFVQASYPTAARTEATAAIEAFAPDGLDGVWLCNSGTEANEAALKFARSATGNSKIVAAKDAFHGRTVGSLSATWKPKYKKPYEPLLDVEFVPYDDSAALAEAVDEETAAVILEPVQGEAGINPASAEYLKAAREVTEETDTALIFDEVQTGLARTGTNWACEAAGVTPDILTSAKGLASGLPMGATVCADWIVDGAGPHGSTFSGGPVISAAATATLEVIDSENLVENAAAVGAYLLEELDAAGFEARGAGLMVGVEVDQPAGKVLKNLALNEQVLALPAGRSVVRLLPPLTVTEDHVDTLVEALERVTETEVPA